MSIEEPTLQERFHAWTQALQLGFECKVFFGVDDLKVFIVVPKEGSWRPVGWLLDHDGQRCRHEFEWVQQGQWKCHSCNYLLGAIFWERHGIVLLKSMAAEDVLGLKRA